MKKLSFEEAIELLSDRKTRYPPDAYRFLRESLDFTVKLLEKPVSGQGRHVTGQELLEGIRQYALQEYGVMAHRVLRHWNIQRTEDVGEMVFQLVELGVLGRTENDRIEDFAGGYDFEQAFVAPFRAPAPSRRRRRSALPARPSRSPNTHGRA